EASIRASNGLSPRRLRVPTSSIARFAGPKERNPTRTSYPDRTSPVLRRMGVGQTSGHAADASSSERRNRTRPIHWAVYRVDYELMEALIAKKARVDVRN